MSLDAFKGIFWWEWAHRLLGRVIGVVFALPFLAFLLMRTSWARSLFSDLPQIPSRLIWRCWVLLALGGLQGVIGWWMVTSGLSERIDVAPERLTIHLGLALVLFVGLIWTGLESWSGPDPVRPPEGWSRGATLLLGLVFVQCLLGGLVAGAKAGFIHTDWPLMSGGWLPPVDWSAGLLAFLHDQALVQFNHRIGAYVVFLAVLAYAVQAWRWRQSEGLGMAAFVLLLLVLLQAVLGIVTLIHAVPLSLGALHQAGAVVVLAAATVNLWLVRRSQPRLFVSGPRSRLF